MDARNLTTEALSELTGISVSRLEEYESGEFTAKSDEIIEIGKALDVPPLVLMKGGGIVHASHFDENDHRVSKWDMY